MPAHATVIVFCLCFMGLQQSFAADDGTLDYRITAAKGPYFFCDQRVIEDRWLMERFVVPPQRHPKNPLMTRQFAWEGTGPHIGGSVLRDPVSQKFLMWYSVFNREAYDKRLPFSYNVCLAQSDDGIDWQRPSTGVFNYQDSTDNNVIRLGTDKTQNIDVCLNPHPDRWPGKFLSIHNQKGGVFVSVSQDGKSFTRLFEKPAIAYHSDTHNNLVYDEVRDRWLLFCRPRAWVGYHKRRVSMQTSSDLEHWSHERTILIPTEAEIPEYYGMTVFRRGDLYFGVVQIYENKSGSIHLELACSGDGEHWDFLPSHPPFLPRGEAHRWDAGMVLMADNPVDVGDELRFYYSGFELDHNTKEENIAAIGLATSERDRLIGLRPSSPEPGLIMTRPFLLQNRQLTLNAIVRGRITAELRTDANKTIPGFAFADSLAITATGFALPIAWREQSLGSLPQGDVRLLLRLENAEIFSFSLNETAP